MKGTKEYNEKNVEIYRKEHVNILRGTHEYIERNAGIYRRCHEKTSYVYNFALSFYCMNGSMEGRYTNYKNSSMRKSESEKLII